MSEENNHLPLSDLVEPRTEKVLPKDCPKLPYIGLDDIEAHSMRLVGTKPADGMKSASKRFYPGDVLYSRLRPYLNKVWASDLDGICSAEFIVLPSNENLDAKFLAYRLNAADFVAFANSLNAGDRPRVDFDQISSFFLPPFSLQRQRQVVAKIDELFSELDAAEASFKQARKQLGAYRQSLLKRAFEGKLTERWRAENADKLESAEELLERIRKERERAFKHEIASWELALSNWQSSGENGKKPPKPKKPDEPVLKDSEPPQWLPLGWHYLSLSQTILSLRQGWSPKCERYPAENGAWAVMTTTAIQPLQFYPEENKALPKTLHPRPWITLEDGDILITRAGPRSRCGVICRVTSDHQRLMVCDKAYRIRFPRTEISSNFIELLLNSRNVLSRIEKLKTGINDSGVNITQSAFLKLHIPVPPLSEQNEIVRILDEQFEAIEQNEKEIDSALAKIEALRQSILKKAFSGKLVPQDPSDEPASVLLERIQEERGSAEGTAGGNRTKRRGRVASKPAGAAG